MHTSPRTSSFGDAARAAEWYGQAFSARSSATASRCPTANLCLVELWFGDSAVMLADEFPEMGVLSPLSVGGTSVVLAPLLPRTSTSFWQRAIQPRGAEVSAPVPGTAVGATDYGQFTDPSATAGGSPISVRDGQREEMVRAEYFFFFFFF